MFTTLSNSPWLNSPATVCTLDKSTLVLTVKHLGLTKYPSFIKLKISFSYTKQSNTLLSSLFQGVAVNPTTLLVVILSTIFLYWLTALWHSSTISKSNSPFSNILSILVDFPCVRLCLVATITLLSTSSYLPCTLPISSLGINIDSLSIVCPLNSSWSTTINTLPVSNEAT